MPRACPVHTLGMEELPPIRRRLRRQTQHRRRRRRRAAILSLLLLALTLAAVPFSYALSAAAAVPGRIRARLQAEGFPYVTWEEMPAALRLAVAATTGGETVRVLVPLARLPSFTPRAVRPASQALVPLALLVRYGLRARQEMLANALPYAPGATGVVAGADVLWRRQLPGLRPGQEVLLVARGLAGPRASQQAVTASAWRLVSRLIAHGTLSPAAGFALYRRALSWQGVLVGRSLPAGFE